MRRCFPGWTTASTAECFWRRASLVLVVAVGLGGSSLAAAGQDSTEFDTELHNGAFLGFALGATRADVSVRSDSSLDASGWSGGGRSMVGKIGFALERRALLAFEYSVWRNPGQDDTLPEEETRYLGLGALTVSFFPDLGGFYLRGGMGYGRLFARLDGATADSNGLAAILGMGHEWRIDESMSISAQVDAAFLDASGISASLTQFMVHATMYFETGD